MNHLNKKITALTLLTVIAFAAVSASAMIMATHATDSNSTDTNSTTSTSTSTTDSNVFNCWASDAEGFAGPRFGGHGHGGFGGYGNIEVSEEFQTTVTNIANNDTDVQNLTSEGYNVTAIVPIIKSVVNGDGTVTTQATSAIVLMQNGTSGFAQVTVDITNAKVTQIAITTYTVIDKSDT